MNTEVKKVEFPTQEIFEEWLNRQPKNWLRKMATESIFVSFIREWLLNTPEKHGEIALIVNRFEH